MSEEDKLRGSAGLDQQQYYNYYGTFQGVANYHPPPLPHQPPPSQPQPQPQPHHVVVFPQPVAPPASATVPVYYPQAYQTVTTGYAVINHCTYERERLPCCGLGMGWFLFIVGFFLGGIPWYVGTFVLLCVRVDYREKPGYVACAMATVLAMIAVTLGATKGAHRW